VLGAATVLAVSDIPAAPVLGLMALGVVTALVGHIMSDRVIVGVGVGVIFLATLAMVIFAFASYQGGNDDPRPAPKDCPLCGTSFVPGTPAPPTLTRRT
jgi:hypothetical protein